VPDVLTIATEFSPKPGPRYSVNGKYSGQEFLEKILEKRFLAAESAKQTLTVNVDGLRGYPSSFIDGSFGELMRKVGRSRFEAVIRIKAEKNDFALDEINYILSTADKRRN